MDPEELMRTVIAGVERLDLEPLLAALHDDIVWKSASKHQNVFRFGGDYHTKLGAIEALSQFTMDYTFHHIWPKEIFVLGDVVWGLFDVELDYNAKGMDPVGRPEQRQTVELEMAIRWRLKDNKIIEHQSFYDTASLLIQQGHPPGD